MTVFKWVGKLAPYIAAVGLCALALGIVLQLWRADLNVPFKNTGDAILAQSFVKTLLENGVYYHTDRAGAPFGMELRDYPVPESLTFSELRVLGWVLRTHNPIPVMNCFFLLTFFLITLTSLFVFRHFKMATMPALAVGVLYAFLPYHFFRGVRHPFLSAYYLIPLTVMVILWLHLGRMSAPWRRKAKRAETETDERPPASSWRRWLFAVPLCLLVSSGGAYYAFFGCFFFIAAALACAVRERRLGPLVAGATLVAVVTCGFAVNMLPFVIFQRQEEVNPAVAHRPPAEAEMYGLKLTELVLPVSGHRIRELRRLKERYLTSPGMPLAYDFSDGLGLVGLIGFVFVLGVLLFRARSSNALADRQDNTLTLSGLGSLLVCGLLLSGIGGLGSLFAHYVSPEIRCYDRMSVYLSFMALFGAAWLLDDAVRRLGRAGWLGRIGGGLLCLLVLIGGVFDQTTTMDVPSYQTLKAEHASICGFVAAIERTLPPGAMVLQLPFIHFPEAPFINHMSNADHFRMYVNSHSLRWSHGVVNGRLGSDVLSLLCAAPIEETLERFAVMGYQGIHIDRRGYADKGRDIEARLTALTGAAPVASADGRDVFFDIRPYTERIKRRYTEAQWDRQREWALAPVVLRWGKGFQLEQFDDHKNWRHSSTAQAEATVINPLKEARPVTLRFRAFSCSPIPARLTLSSGLMEETLQLNSAGAEFRRTFLAPPGETPLHFACDGVPLATPTGPLVFTLIGYDLVNESAAAPIGVVVPRYSALKP